jgi:hypothetical protein
MHLLFHALELFAMESSCTAAGVTIKKVICERCSEGYSYRLRRQVTAKAGGYPGVDPVAANLNAQHRLHVLLQSEIDAVPCPHCGWYQEEMVRKIRKLHFRVLFRAGLFLLGIAPILAFVAILLPAFDVEIGPVARNPHTVRALAFLAIIALVLGGCLTVAKLFLSRLHDPNARHGVQKYEL